WGGLARVKGERADQRDLFFLEERCQLGVRAGQKTGHSGEDPLAFEEVGRPGSPLLGRSRNFEEARLQAAAVEAAPSIELVEPRRESGPNRLPHGAGRRQQDADLQGGLADAGRDSAAELLQIGHEVLHFLDAHAEAGQGDVQGVARRIDPQRDRPFEQPDVVGRMLPAAGMSQAVGFGEVRPGEVGGRDSAFGPPLAVAAVAARAGHGGGGHLDAGIAHHGGDLAAGRAGAFDVDLPPALDALLLLGGWRIGGQEDERQEREDAEPARASHPLSFTTLSTMVKSSSGLASPKAFFHSPVRSLPMRKRFWWASRLATDCPSLRRASSTFSFGPVRKYQ